MSAFTHRISLLEKELEELKDNSWAALKRQKLTTEVEKEKAICRRQHFVVSQSEALRDREAKKPRGGSEGKKIGCCGSSKAGLG